MRRQGRERRLGLWQWTFRGVACGSLVWLVAAQPAGGAFPITSESLALASTYGQGVHAYFAGDYQRSYDDLSQAIAAGTQDPRAYYFRGLAALRLGRLDEAEADFSSGADREMTQSGDWRVGRSLERVQGGDRLRLERHRARARIVALQNDREAVRRRYSEIEDAQDDVLRRRRRPAAGPADAGNPFEEGAEPAAKPAEELPAMKDEPTTESADDAKAGDDEKPEADGDKPMKDDDDKPAADDDKPAADDDANPADEDKPKADADAAEKPADDDPFGDKPAEAKPEAEASSEPAADN